MLGGKAVKGRVTGLHKIILKKLIKFYKFINPRITARSG